MQPGDSIKRVKRRLTRLVQEYEADGYTVIRSPSPSQLPDELEECSFDLVATRDNQVVAVVVRTRQTLALTGSHDLCYIAERVERQPDWSLELVITNPSQQRTVLPEHATKVAG